MKRWPNEGRVTSTSAEVEGNDRRMAWLYVIGGAIGLLAAAVLLLEKVALLEDPTYVPSCSINPILSCGSIMQASQAEAFGFPNPLIGVAAFPVVITTGVALLAGDVPALVLARAARRDHRWPRVRALADLPEPLPDRRSLPVLHGRLGGDHPPLLVHGVAHGTNLTPG